MFQVSFPMVISGTGIALPGRLVQSSDLEESHQMPAGWCRQHTGVEQRYWALPGEDVSMLGARALKEALEKANLLYEDLDLVICGSATYDHPIPHSACLIQEHFAGSKRPVPGWDIDATCLGFITSLDVASRLLDGKRYRHIAIVCSEVCSTSLNPADPETLALMGDGASACIVSYSPGQSKGIVAAHMQTWPEYASLTLVPAGGNRIHGLTHPGDQEYYFRMDGKKLLKTALRYLPAFTGELLVMGNLKWEDLTCIIPHQASLNGITGFARLMDTGLDRFFINIHQYGNTLSASVGIAFHEAVQTQRAQSGNIVLLLGTGAGFSIGGIILVL